VDPFFPHGRHAISLAPTVGHTHVSRLPWSHHDRSIRAMGAPGEAGSLHGHPPRGRKVALVWTSTGWTPGPSPALLLRCVPCVPHPRAFADWPSNLLSAGGGFSLPPRPDYLPFIGALKKDISAVLGDASVVMLEYCELVTLKPPLHHGFLSPN
jgi:hypothetical protein